MTDWNFNMAEAPRGQTETRSWTKEDGTEAQRSVFIPERIIAAAGDEKQTVTVSNWLPDQNRWNMFAKEHPPIAWMAWPEHPAASAHTVKVDKP